MTLTDTILRALSDLRAPAAPGDDALTAAWRLALVARDSWRFSDSYEAAAARSLALGLATGDEARATCAAAFIVNPSLSAVA